MWQSALEEDVAALPAGLETPARTQGTAAVGWAACTHGGGAGAAACPGLLVLDDLASALDVHTAAIMWERILQPGLTCIVATNQPELLRRATQVVAAAAFSVQNQTQDDLGGF